jgi:hypothetical protein
LEFGGDPEVPHGTVALAGSEDSLLDVKGGHGLILGLESLEDLGRVVVGHAFPDL